MFEGRVATLAVAAILVLGGCDDRAGAPVTGPSSAVVTDETTGLVWLRCALGQQWQAPRCTGEARTSSRADAQSRVNALNEERHLGIDQWRLPSIVELAALRRCDHGFVDETFSLPLMAEQEPVVVPRWCARENTPPAIDTARFPDTPAVKFWAGSLNERQQTSYAVDFFSAWIGLNEDDESLHAVRPVADPAPRH